jgi:pimeloyl-ACP methyl ester carboxylesterase
MRALALALSCCVSMALLAAEAPKPEEHFFQSAGVRIRYLTAGRGEPVVLIHGWAATAEMWTALMSALSRDHQVIALDCRGHGKSGKPHLPAQYGKEMAEDVVRLLDHLRVRKADVVGYSMGGGIVMKMLVDHPDRLLSAVSGGFRSDDDPWDENLIKDLESGMPLSEAMIRNRPQGMPEPSPQQREMMRQMDAGQDPQALAAQRLGNAGLRITDEMLAKNQVPLLVICGERDHPERLEGHVKNFGAARFSVVRGRGTWLGTGQPRLRARRLRHICHIHTRSARDAAPYGNSDAS